MTAWWTGNIYDSCVRFCVPIFVMLTGALVLPKEYKLAYFIKNKFTRILVPFLFWSIIYIISDIIIGHARGQQFTLFQIAKFSFTQLKDGASYHFWYIYMIIGLYLFIPIIGPWVRAASEKGILYFLTIWFIVILSQQSYLHSIKPNIDFTYFTGYLGYLVLGYYLGTKHFEHIKWVKIISLLLVLTGISMTAVGTYILSRYSGFFRQEFYDYLTPNVLIVAIGTFLFFKHVHITNYYAIQTRTFISKYSYGIYLVHVFVLTLLNITGLNFPHMTSSLQIPLVSSICFFISLGIVFIIDKIPYGKYIAG